MAVPYTFATATGSIPLSQLDTNFATGIIIGNTTVTLGDTITTINNLTLANVTVTSASFSNVTLTGSTNVASTTTVFSGTGARIQGDFTTSTVTNRPMFQTSTTNGTTTVGVVTNGTATTSNFVAFNNSTGTAASYLAMTADTTFTSLDSGVSSGGTYLPLRFLTGGAEAARFDTSGRFLLGTTSSTYAGSNGNAKLIPTGVSNAGISTGTWANVGSAIEFYANVSGTVVYSGAVSLNGNTAVLNSASDYRLKSNPQPLTGSGTFIDALQPKTWTWTGDGQRGVGFIAHEVAPVSPTSVVGDKDAVDANGNPKYQSLAYGSAEFIANIVAELQSLRARVAALESA